jgi:hypothetical protein
MGDTDLKLCAHRFISHSLAFGSSRRLEALSDEQRTRARVLEEAQRDRKVATLIRYPFIRLALSTEAPVLLEVGRTPNLIYGLL